jgi:hypothetical protein
MRNINRSYIKAILFFTLDTMSNLVALFFLALGAVEGFSEFPTLGAAAIVKGSLPALFFLVWLCWVYGDLEKSFYSLQELFCSSVDKPQDDQSEISTTLGPVDSDETFDLSQGSRFAFKALMLLVVGVGAALYFV